MQKKWLILAGIFLFLIPSVFGIQTEERTTKQYLSPFYVNSMAQNTDYNYTVAITPPDGLSSVKSAILTFDMWINPARNFSVTVNGGLCNTQFYYISTTYASAGRAVATFDCSNRITKAGIYNITYRVSGGNIGSSTAWLDLTYMNNPKSTMQIFGTEYAIGDNAKSWLQLINSSGYYVEDAVCLLDIYYPDNTQFIENAQMSYLGKEGIYYYDFLIPNYVGIYPTIADCYYDVVSQEETSDNGTIWIGTNVANDYTNTWTKNGIFWRINEALSSGQYRISYVFNFTGVTPPALLSSLTVDWWGKWNGQTGDELIFYIWNYTDSSWYEFPNRIANTGGSNTEITNTLQTTNLTISGLISANQIRVMIIDANVSDITSSQVQNDYIAVKLNYLSNPEWQETKGSSEIHIKSGNGNSFLKMETLCGDETSDCAYFTDDDEFDQTEGEIEDNITIFTLTHDNDVDTEWVYHTPFAVDCTALYWVKFYNDTEWIDITDTISFSSEADKENCIMKVPITLNENDEYHEKYYYRIKFDNYMKWEVLYTKDAVTVINNTLYPLCMAMGQQYNYTFIVPITDSTNFTIDPNVIGCERFFDDVYWVNLYYDESIPITISGDYTSYLIESRFYLEALFRELSTGNFFVSSENAASLANILDTIPTSNLRYVGGTEYTTSQNGSLQLQFLTTSGGNPVPVNNGNCIASVYYPNSSMFMNNQSMSYLTGSNGIYFKNFTVPSTEGVYISSFYCNRTTSPPPSTILGYTSGSFHVNPIINVSVDLSGITNYLITINSTTYQINQSLYQDYISLLTAINSVNMTANQTLSYVTALNGSVFDLSIVELSHFQQIISLLNSINYTLNTTLEYKLDLINGTVMQINQSQTAYYLSLLGAINSLEATLNASIIGLNSSLTQYLVVVNDTTYQINQSQFTYYTNLLQAINSANDTQNWQYLNLLSLLNDINATGNATFQLVASINKTLIDDIFVILKDINFTTNTTLEYKLDLINYTTWQSWVMLQNLTIGNVSVTANVNWTEGVPIIWNASGQSQIDYSLLSLSQEGIQLVVETLTCASNTTLVHTMNITNCVFGQCVDSVKNITETCAYGCANSMCVPAPTIQYFSILGVVLLIAGFTYVIWRAGGKG